MDEQEEESGESNGEKGLEEITKAMEDLKSAPILERGPSRVWSFDEKEVPGHLRLFECFVVIGAQAGAELISRSSSSQTKAGCYEPSVLCSWPPQPSTSETIGVSEFPAFSFPHGVHTYTSQSPGEGIVSQFIFLLRVPGTSKSLWGVCVKVLEKFEETSELVGVIRAQDSGRGRQEEFTGDKPKLRQRLLTERCYCLLTTVPYFDAHFELLIRMLHTSGDSNAPDAGFSLLSTYYHHAVPEFGSKSEIYLPCGSKICLRVPDPHTLTGVSNGKGSENFFTQSTGAAVLAESEMLEGVESVSLIWSVKTLCQFISLDIILVAVGAALLEVPLIFICEDLGTLSSIVLSMIPLMPFSYQSIVLPVVPMKLSSILDAPVPYIVGIAEEEILYEVSGGNPYDIEAIIIDINKNKVLSTPKETEVPQLPGYGQIRSKLKALHHYLGEDKKSWWSFGRKTTSLRDKNDGLESRLAALSSISEIMFVRCVQFCSVLRQTIGEIGTRAASYTISKLKQEGDSPTRVSVLLEESFVSSFPRQDRKWIKRFLDTQIFSCFYRGSRPLPQVRRTVSQGC